MICASRHGHLGLIELNRPKQLNACNTQMCQSLHQQLESWDLDPTIKLIVLRGRGERGFCAGGDIKQLFQHGEEQLEQSIAFFFHEYQLNHRISTLKTPIISLMHGFTMGGGVALAHYTQYRIGEANLSWAMPETGIGFFPDVGMSYTLSRLPHHIGRYLALTGIAIDANTAYELGLIDAIVPMSHFETCIQTFTTTDEQPESVLQQHHIKPTKANLPTHEIHQCFQHETIDDIIRALETARESTWSNNTLAILNMRSPLSLQITLEALKRAKTMDQIACFEQDFTLCQSFLTHPDFYEGIRAAVIDKDYLPQWKSVTQDWDSFFRIENKQPLF